MQLVLFKRSRETGEWQYPRQESDRSTIPARMLIEAWERSGLTPTQLSRLMGKNKNYWNRQRLEARRTGRISVRVALEMCEALGFDPHECGL